MRRRSSELSNVISLHPASVEVEASRSRHPAHFMPDAGPAFTSEYVSATSVVALMDALTDVFCELSINDVPTALQSVDGALARIIDDDRWACRPASEVISGLTEQFIDIATEATLSRVEPIQLQLAMSP